MPDFTSKDALQAYIGFDIEKDIAAKDTFLEQVVPQWLKDGKAREAKKEIKTVSIK